jgi:hypothetical protein
MAHSARATVHRRVAGFLGGCFQTRKRRKEADMKHFIDTWSMLRLAFWLFIVGMAVGILLGVRV